MCAICCHNTNPCQCKVCECECLECRPTPKPPDPLITKALEFVGKSRFIASVCRFYECRGFITKRQRVALEANVEAQKKAKRRTSRVKAPEILSLRAEVQRLLCRFSPLEIIREVAKGRS